MQPPVAAPNAEPIAQQPAEADLYRLDGPAADLPTRAIIWKDEPADPPPPLPARLTGSLRRGLRRLADFALPPRCVACERALDEHHTLCGRCWFEVRFIRAPVCDRLGIPLPFDAGEPTISAAAVANPPDYDRARAAVHFSGTARRLVHQFKYSDRLDIRTLLVRWLASAGGPMLADADCIVPVPLHRRRLLWRRYNQSAVLALDLAGLAGRRFAPQVLRRTRRTPAQVGLTEEQRRLNVRGAFGVPALHADVVEGRRVLLVDDVITTGATVNACARALRRAGAARVDVLAVAMVTSQALASA